MQEVAAEADGPGQTLHETVRVVRHTHHAPLRVLEHLHLLPHLLAPQGLGQPVRPVEVVLRASVPVHHQEGVGITGGPVTESQPFLQHASLPDAPQPLIQCSQDALVLPQHPVGVVEGVDCPWAPVTPVHQPVLVGVRGVREVPRGELGVEEDVNGGRDPGPNGGFLAPGGELEEDVEDACSAVSCSLEVSVVKQVLQSTAWHTRGQID